MVKPSLGKRFVSLFSPELNGQPALKFDNNLDIICTYCIIPRNMRLDVERVHERYQAGPAQAYFKCRPQFGPVRMVMRGAFPHEKCPFSLDMDFLMKEITNLTSNFT
jgi:hypothetical protein